MPPYEGPAARGMNIWKAYLAGTGSVPALADVSFDFASGRISAVIGPSGAGKSTLLRLLAGATPPDRGQVEVAGVALTGLATRARRRVRRRHVGYIFQQPEANLIEYLTTIEQLLLAAHMRCGRSDRRDSLSLLDALDLREHVESPVVTLSGGEQQRLAFGCAVAGNPQLVLADEPTAQLDRAAADRVLEVADRLAKAGTAFVIATHDQRLVAQASAILSLDHGRVIE